MLALDREVPSSLMEKVPNEPLLSENKMHTTKNISVYYMFFFFLPAADTLITLENGQKLQNSWREMECIA